MRALVVRPLVALALATVSRRASPHIGERHAALVAADGASYSAPQHHQRKSGARGLGCRLDRLVQRDAVVGGDGRDGRWRREAGRIAGLDQEHPGTVITVLGGLYYAFSKVGASRSLDGAWSIATSARGFC